MTELRKVLLLIFAELGFGEPDAGYLDCCERLNEACADWYREHPGAPALWNLPEKLGPVLISGGLDAIDRTDLCGNENAREFARFVDCRTDYKGTLLQLQILLIIQATTARTNAPGGKA